MIMDQTENDSDQIFHLPQTVLRFCFSFDSVDINCYFGRKLDLKLSFAFIFKRLSCKPKLCTDHEQEDIVHDHARVVIGGASTKRDTTDSISCRFILVHKSSIYIWTELELCFCVLI